MCNLDQIRVNEIAVIKQIDCDSFIKKRLLDLGFASGEKIQLILNSPSKSIKAFLIKNTLIAVRNKDSKKIKVEVINEENSSCWES